MSNEHRAEGKIMKRLSVAIFVALVALSFVGVDRVSSMLTISSAKTFVKDSADPAKK